MKQFDYEKELNIQKKKSKRFLIAFIVLSLCFVAIFLTGVFIATFSNRIIIMIIFSIILSIVSIFDIVFFIFGLLFSQKQKRQIYYILGGYLNQIEGKVIAVNGLLTSVNGRQGIEIILENDKNKSSVLFDPVFGEIPFSEGNNIKVKISESFIVQYEVLDA